METNLLALLQRNTRFYLTMQDVSAVRSSSGRSSQKCTKGSGISPREVPPLQHNCTKYSCWN